MDSTSLLTMFSVLVFQVGSRQLQFDFTDAQKKFFQHPMTQFTVLLSMFYIGTRRWLWAITMVLVYYLCLHVLMNESNPYNLFSRQWLRSHGFLPEHLQENRVQLYYENLKKLPL
jgi:hypothetical protein